MEVETFCFKFLIFMRERGGGLVAMDGLFMQSIMPPPPAPLHQSLSFVWLPSL